jgi:hypothetical protein
MHYTPTGILSEEDTSMCDRDPSKPAIAVTRWTTKLAEHFAAAA